MSEKTEPGWRPEDRVRATAFPKLRFPQNSAGCSVFVRKRNFTGAISIAICQLVSKLDGDVRTKTGVPAPADILIPGDLRLPIIRDVSYPVTPNSPLPVTLG
jgi:hypothetical protein